MMKTINNFIGLHKNFYVDESIKHPDRMLNKLKHGRFIKEFYLISLLEDMDRLEIYCSYMFKQKFMRRKPFLFVGIFSSKDKAIEYIRVLSEISVAKFGDFKAKDTIDSLNDAEKEQLKVKGERNT